MARYTCDEGLEMTRYSTTILALWNILVHPITRVWRVSSVEPEPSGAVNSFNLPTTQAVKGRIFRNLGVNIRFYVGYSFKGVGHPWSQLIGVPHSRHLSVSMPCNRPQCGHTVPLSGSTRSSVLAKIHSDLSSITYSARQSRHITLPDSFLRLSLAQNGHSLWGMMRSISI